MVSLRVSTISRAAEGSWRIWLMRIFVIVLDSIPSRSRRRALQALDWQHSARRAIDPGM